MSFDHGGTVCSTARKLGCNMEDLLDFSASINPLGISLQVREALLCAFDQIPHYPDPDATMLVDALAAYHRVQPDMVVPANGSTSLIHLLPAIIKGKKAMIISPAFNEYELGLQKQGWQTVRHILSYDTGFDLDLQRLESDLLRESPDLLFFCNPSNPAGVLYSPETVQQILSLCLKLNIMLVLDEAFMDFCGEEYSAKQAVVASEKGIVLRSMTKFHALAGLRLGCALAAPEIALQLRTARPPWEVNCMAQAAGVAALQDDDFAAATRRMIVEERTLLAKGLADLSNVNQYPSHVNYLLFSLSGGKTAAAVKEYLLVRHRIMVRDCSGFAGLDNSFIRVAVKARGDNMKLLEALDAVLR